MQEQVLEKVNIAEQARALSKPFSMIDLAQVDDLMLSVYLCQGTMPYHRHLDQDELFLVHSGTISLESEWGTVILRPGELAVVRKGIGHRSSSLLRSAVVLIQPRLMANRRNGNRRMFALKDQGRLEKVGVQGVGQQVAVPFVRVPLADVDTFLLYVLSCQGTGPWVQEDRQNCLVLCHTGTLEVEVDSRRGSGERPPRSQGPGDEAVSRSILTGGELVVIPKGNAYRLSSPDGALAIGVERHEAPS